MELVLVLLLDEVTDFFELDKCIVGVVDNQEVHDLHDVVVKVLHLRLVFGLGQQLFESVVLLDEVPRNENRVRFSVH